MTQASVILQELLTSLTGARQGTTLVLDEATLGATSAAALLDLFSQQLQITSFTLEDVQLPASVTGMELMVSGHDTGLALDLTFFEETLGEIAIEALFHAPAIAALQQAFPSLPGDFFNAIEVSGATAAVSVPGLVGPLALASPRYGVAGLVAPGSGLVTTSIAPRVDGQASPPGGSRGLLIEVQTATSGYRVSPLASAWAFEDLGWLVPGLGLLAAFPAIIPTGNLGLRAFELNLYTDAPDLSSISLDVADAADPAGPLWTAADGKVKLADVIVTLDLTYTADEVLSLPGTGSLQGSFSLGSVTLTAQIPSPPTGIWSLTAYPNVPLPTLDDLASLLDGGSSQFKDVLPAGLADIGNFEFSYLRLAVDASEFSLVEFTFALTSTASWPLIPDVVELESLRMSLTIDGTPSVTGTVIGTVQLPDGADIVVSFGRGTPQEPWRLDVVSPAIALPSLGQLAQLAQGQDLAALIKAGGLDQMHFVMTDLNLGLTIAPAKLTNLGFTLQLADADDPLTPALDWEIIPGVLTLTQFSFGFQIDWGDTVSKDVSGTFVLNGLEFDVKFAAQTTQGTSAAGLIAEYSAQGASGTVNVKDLLNSIAPQVAAYVPAGLEIDLADAVLAYLDTDTKKFLFAMDIAVEFPISELPLVGTALPADAVGVKNLKVVVTSAALSAQDVAFINTMSAKPVLAPPAAGTPGDAIPAGFSMTAELDLGALSILMTSPPARPPSRELAGRAGGPLAAAPPADPVMWIPVQKTFGPVQFERVGFAVTPQAELSLLLEAALSLAELSIGLTGLQASMPIQSPYVPSFDLAGLQAQFSGGGLVISGGLEKAPGSAPAAYTGELTVQLGQFGATMLGSYTTVNGQPSLFAFLFLEAPLGGPAFFFVTGLAGGFGYNRSLQLPAISGVEAYPLVAGAMGNLDATTTESELTTYIQPTPNEDWLAAGVRFTSFEMVQSFALLTIAFGAHVEIALLGESAISLPVPAAGETATPVAQADMVLMVDISPSNGQLAVCAQLTPQSWVIDPAAHLTGGFAFYAWFPPSAQPGDFVVTLGGYNPYFTPPSYYPQQVPRLGLNWQLSSELSISGGLYFALTPSVLMAGGYLKATWQSGDLSAWFDAQADFLIRFKPFQYQVTISIAIGVSLTLNLLVTTVRITLHIGVSLTLWGPPFGGTAIVDLSVISFTIGFGAPQPGPLPDLTWPQFRQSFLPPANSSERGSAPRGPLATAPGAGPPPTPTDSLVTVSAAQGLLGTVPAGDTAVWLVSPASLQIVVATQVPSTSASVITSTTFTPSGTWTDQLGVGPMGAAAGEFTAVLTVAISHDNVPDPDSWAAAASTSGVPKGLYLSTTSQMQTDGTVGNALLGVILTPAPPAGGSTLPVPVAELLADDPGAREFGWSAAIPPDSDNFNQDTAMAQMQSSLVDPAVTQARNSLLTALRQQGLDVAATVEVAGFAAAAAGLMASPPRLRLLGEQVPPATVGGGPG